MSMTRLFFSFEGRMSRQPYWLATTLTIVVMLGLIAILYHVLDECVKIGTFMLLLVAVHPVLLDHAGAQRKAAARPQQVGMVAIRLLSVARRS